MSTAQERILAQYQGLMQVNASSHLLRAARKIGLIDELRGGQRTMEQLVQNLKLQESSLPLMIDALMAVGIVEKYDNDHALSRAGHLLCQYDDDLGDSLWEKLADRIQGKTDRSGNDDKFQHHYLAATQWAHTASAMQAAEILDIGGEDQKPGIRILDLGGGSAVWSCAMAHRDAESTVTVVDDAASIEAAKATAESIEMADRFSAIEGDPVSAPVPAESFDLVLIAQRIACLGPEQVKNLIKKAVEATAAGGRVVVIDLFRGPSAPHLAEAIEALRLDLATVAGQMPGLEEIQQQLSDAGLKRVQFAFLAASKVNMGMAVGEKLAVSAGV
ncbi:ubiquinone/menaquinone biosynthesis methyltransferase [Rubripirellula obstinata]|uniref:Ubiquinone/menaquinone biosynthesis methyltransferase n=1 Tax=Rubripirellula obstinata TaxID=406547 RepID=A0A5B1CF06_9BACT|nr:class I SAM-dependent methyltransferase [Rubripirellula obstinata]KAA1259747.1 ubiquinone/menaquinone biosynthesis methyltransferase [Rubripirellula obstinata]